MALRTPTPWMLRHDRIAARAAWLVQQGKLDSRELRQMLPKYGSWVLGPLIASGRSSVHQARHTVFPWKAAIKLGTVDHEARLLRSLHDRNIVRLLDAGEGFLVMDFARHGSLKDRLYANGRMTQTNVVRLAKGLCRALIALNRAGYDHGDLKPGNILIDRGCVWLADFGLARRRNEPRTNDEVRGSWPYLAPECFHGHGDSRADVYALGLTLYEALSGSTAVPAKNFHEARRMHHDLKLEPLHWTIPGVSRGFAQLILRLTAKHPEDRPADLRALHTELLTLEAQR